MKWDSFRRKPTQLYFALIPRLCSYCYRWYWLEVGQREYRPFLRTTRYTYRCYDDRFGVVESTLGARLAHGRRSAGQLAGIVKP